MTRLLVDFAAEVNMQNEFGNTPLHAGESSLHLFAMPKLSPAIQRGKHDIVSLLINAGANVHLQNQVRRP